MHPHIIPTYYNEYLRRKEKAIKFTWVYKWLILTLFHAFGPLQTNSSKIFRFLYKTISWKQIDLWPRMSKFQSILYLKLRSLFTVLCVWSFFLVLNALRRDLTEICNAAGWEKRKLSWTCGTWTHLFTVFKHIFHELVEN